MSEHFGDGLNINSVLETNKDEVLDIDKSAKFEEKEATGRSVSEIMNKYDVFVIHGIHPNFVPNSNSPLENDTTWETKMKIALALEPTISASTIKAGDTSDNMWAGIGFILSGGTVVSAAPSDAATRAKGILSERSRRVDDEKIETEISDAITNRPENKYNELAISSPKITALYWNGSTSRLDSRVPYEQVARFANEVSLPIYCLSNGELIDWNKEKDPNTNLYQHVSKNEIEKLQGINEEERAYLYNELIGNESPFKIEVMPDGLAVMASDYGRMAFASLSSKFKMEDGSTKESTTIDGEDYRCLSEFPTIEGRIQYLRDTKGVLYQRLLSKSGKDDGSITADSRTRISESLAREDAYAHIHVSTMSLGRSVSSPNDYLEALKEIVKDTVQKSSGETSVEYHKKLARELAFHVMGFATEAKEMGDIETYEHAKEIAHSVLEEDAYAEVIRKRLGKQGGFLITKNDLDGSNDVTA
ncbi:MAG: hypothetical protein NTZ36_03145 [Candidatus Jorgensenbacteria bacterium]|nr:hypothetical protein [Candidatus Jorgensenbacteria bacterium]